MDDTWVVVCLFALFAVMAAFGEPPRLWFRQHRASLKPILPRRRNAAEITLLNAPAVRVPLRVIRGG